jgi:hypothetical protein
MNEVFWGVLAALAVREVYLEVFAYIQYRLVRKRLEDKTDNLLAFRDELEDLLADD